MSVGSRTKNLEKKKEGKCGSIPCTGQKAKGGPPSSAKIRKRLKKVARNHCDTGKKPSNTKQEVGGDQEEEESVSGSAFER